ncbi:MAG: alkaline phosphatase PhoX [Longimicrobiales bacterium]
MSRFTRRDFIWRAAALGGGAVFAPSLSGLSAWSKDVYTARPPGRGLQAGIRAPRAVGGGPRVHPRGHRRRSETGIVYETEDARYDAERPEEMPGAGFYRFNPNRPGELGEGGRLQMLAVDGSPRYNTTRGQTPGRALSATRVDIDDPDPSDADTRHHAVFQQGPARGDAIFSRLEGCWYADGAIYFNSTNGGDQNAGQVWQYRPTDADTGELVLIFESPSRDVLNSPDNVCVSPRGGIVICEDTDGDVFVRELSAEGDIFDFVQQPVDRTGQSGDHRVRRRMLSPDGSILFFNIQGGTRSNGTEHGATYALWGPREEGSL